MNLLRETISDYYYGSVAIFHMIVVCGVCSKLKRRKRQLENRNTEKRNKHEVARMFAVEIL